MFEPGPHITGKPVHEWGTPNSEVVASPAMSVHYAAGGEMSYICPTHKRRLIVSARPFYHLRCPILNCTYKKADKWGPKNKKHNISGDSPLEPPAAFRTKKDNIT